VNSGGTGGSGVRSKRCKNCFELTSPGKVCGTCGWDGRIDRESDGSLPPGTVLRDDYMIGRTLGHGGFGITYLAWDLRLNRRRAIKEYFPRGVVARANQTAQVSLRPGQADLYKQGIQKYIEEARLLAEFESHDCIVSPLTFFRLNGTAYLVMEYLEGETFHSYVQRQGGSICYEHALHFLRPVIDALAAIHSRGITHRDVTPDNVYLTVEGKTKLIDFGAARQQLASQRSNMTVIVRDRYAPPEQYSQQGRQGPWTDVYAFCATLYFAITGQPPPQAMDRFESDRIVPPSRLGAEIPPAAEAALLRGLALRTWERIELEELARALDDDQPELAVEGDGPSAENSGDPGVQGDLAGSERSAPPLRASRSTKAPERPRTQLAGRGSVAASAASGRHSMDSRGESVADAEFDPESLHETTRDKDAEARMFVEGEEAYGASSKPVLGGSGARRFERGPDPLDDSGLLLSDLEASGMRPDGPDPLGAGDDFLGFDARDFPGGDSDPDFTRQDPQTRRLGERPLIPANRTRTPELAAPESDRWSDPRPARRAEPPQSEADEFDPMSPLPPLRGTASRDEPAPVFTPTRPFPSRPLPTVRSRRSGQRRNLGVIAGVGVGAAVLSAIVWSEYIAGVDAPDPFAAASRSGAQSAVRQSGAQERLPAEPDPMRAPELDPLDPAPADSSVSAGAGAPNRGSEPGSNSRGSASPGSVYPGSAPEIDVDRLALSRDSLQASSVAPDRAVPLPSADPAPSDPPMAAVAAASGMDDPGRVDSESEVANRLSDLADRVAARREDRQRDEVRSSQASRSEDLEPVPAPPAARPTDDRLRSDVRSNVRSATPEVAAGARQVARADVSASARSSEAAGALASSPARVSDRRPLDTPSEPSASQLYARALDSLDARESESALRYLEQAAQLGSEAAMLRLGRAYVAGEMVSASDAQATRWYQRAAEAGSVEAQYALGLRFEQGSWLPLVDGRAPNPTRFRDRWTLAITQLDDLRSQVDERAIVASRSDLLQAQKWYQQAVARGDARARIRLALLYWDDRGGLRNEAESYRLLAAAAESGDPQAQMLAGYCLWRGFGTQPDGAAARTWFERSAGQGVSFARAILEDLDRDEELQALWERRLERRRLIMR